MQPEQKFVLYLRKLLTKINYVYSEYYFDNILFHYYFLKCWIPQMMFFIIQQVILVSIIVMKKLVIQKQ
ncbi:hypothetical protein SDAV_002003 [Spiroplasma phoeniceum P40]|uniref:Uncharacterized protein n=1 Tax=Spiroplasma phoeniceum P40 TaxID=1276259 RepID=A0A345DRU9_9MOLU|nr:hypothetical protein SDAV_002003 [Spiroplasma phoeniceum P40]